MLGIPINVLHLASVCYCMHSRTLALLHMLDNRSLQHYLKGCFKTCPSSRLRSCPCAGVFSAFLTDSVFAPCLTWDCTAGGSMLGTA